MPDLFPSDYFINELHQYYIEHGKTLSEEVIRVLGKEPLQLSQREKEVFVKFILPRRQQIKQAMRSRYLRSSEHREIWKSQLEGSEQSIIGQIVAEMLIEQEMMELELLHTTPRNPAESSSMLEQPKSVESLDSPTPSSVKVRSETAPVVHISTRSPGSPLSEEGLELESPEREIRKRKAKKTAFFIGMGILIGVTFIFALMGLIGGRETTRKGVPTGPAYEAKSTAFALEVTSPAPGQSFTTPEIVVEGWTEPDSDVSVKVKNSDFAADCRSDGEGRFSAKLILVEGANTVEVIARKGDIQEVRNISCSYTLDPATYKSLCKNIDYESLSMNPEVFKGQKYLATGKVVHVEQEGNSTHLTMNVVKGKYNFWSGTIYVIYDGVITIYKNSIITVWGEVQGAFSTYTSAGRSVAFPLVRAKFIEL
jgi:hypothetical protein